MFRRLRGVFGPGETQNERLLREAGIGAAEPAARERVEDEPPVSPFPEQAQPGADLSRPYVPGVLQVRPREWEALAFVQAPTLVGEKIDFYALADGSLIVEAEDGDMPLDPLADALDGKLEPPYRAHAERSEGQTWWVGANPVQLVELPAVAADDFALGVYDGAFTVDESPVEDSSPYEPLDELAARNGLLDYAAEATRVEDATFAVTITPL